MHAVKVLHTANSNHLPKRYEDGCQSYVCIDGFCRLFCAIFKIKVSNAEFRGDKRESVNNKQSHKSNTKIESKSKRRKYRKYTYRQLVAQLLLW